MAARPCKNGHPLQLGSAGSPYNCDFCSTARPDEQHFQCRSCNFDSCPNCCPVGAPAGYPPQTAYPPQQPQQGYPPQAAGYPPQQAYPPQQGYPPQTAGYPPQQSYPPQNQPQPAAVNLNGPGPHEVWLYVDSQFKGAVHKLTADAAKFSAFNLNDKVSSLKCGPGVTVELFVDSEYKGKSQVYQGDVPTFGALNDKFSSLKFR